MTSIDIGKHSLELPEGYTKKPLPGMKEWVAALRSGEYKQGREVLCRTGGGPLNPPTYCCLGVLCEIQGRPKTTDGILTWYDLSSTSLALDNPTRIHLDKEGTFPVGVCVRLHENGVSKRLASLNDNGLTFAEIADVIEALWQEPEEGKDTTP